jgi:hypothetical protein
MKILIVLLSLVSFSAIANVEVITQENAASFYDRASAPELAPWVGIALPGRCFFKNPGEKKTATVLMTFSTGEGFAIAPLSADKRAENFFDNLSFSTIERRFPQIKNLTREVFFTHEEAILYKRENKDFYEARIKEFEDYFFVKVILENKAVRYCYYNKN